MDSMQESIGCATLSLSNIINELLNLKLVNSIHIHPLLVKLSQCPKYILVKCLIKYTDAIFFYLDSRFNCQPNKLKHQNIRCEQVDSSKIAQC